MRVTREYCNRIGLEAVAIFEAAKGTLALVFAIWLLPTSHRDVHELAAGVIRALRLHPEAHAARTLSQAAERLAGIDFRFVIALLLAYVVVRFIEAYGLWRARTWAVWFALLSGALYVPWEAYGLVQHPTPFRWALIAINLGIVLYMAAIRWNAHHRRPDCPEELQTLRDAV